MRVGGPYECHCPLAENINCVAVVSPLPHARNHFVITTGFVATKVAERKVTEAKSDEEKQIRTNYPLSQLKLAVIKKLTLFRTG